MSIFGGNVYGTSMEDDLKNPNELLESYIYDEVSRLPDDKREQFVKEHGTVMCEAGLIGKRTLVRLSKGDDLERRLGMAALQIAKDNDDPLFAQLSKIRTRERELLEKINTKYMSKASKAAKIGQKQYLKTKIPSGFMR